MFGDPFKKSAKAAIVHALENCPYDEGQKRTAVLNTTTSILEPRTHDPERFAAWRGAVRDVCPKDILGNLFEQVFEKTNLPLPQIDPAKAAQGCFGFCEGFGVPDFDLTNPLRAANGTRTVCQPHEMLFALEYIGHVQPELYAGTLLFIDTLSAFAQACNDQTRFLWRASRVGRNNPWLHTVTDRLAKELDVAGDRGMLAASMVITTRARDAANAMVEAPSSADMVAGWRWLYNANFFKADVACPASGHVVTLAGMSLFEGTERQQSVLARAVHKSVELSRTQPEWTGYMEKCAEAMQHTFSIFVQHYPAYSETLAARAMASLRARTAEAAQPVLPPRTATPA
jgi:hypothetical protein